MDGIYLYYMLYPPVYFNVKIVAEEHSVEPATGLGWKG